MSATPLMIIDDSPEEWRVIPSHPKYEASSRGRIRRRTKAQGARVGKILKPHINHEGYHYVYPDQIGSKVHRLVAETYIGESTLEVNHLDGDKSNNRVSNLEYTDRRGNCIHSYAIGLSVKKLTRDDVFTIRKLRKKGYVYREIAALFNVSGGLISHICNGRTWGWLKP